MEFLNFGKGRLAYTVLGKGKPLLFIHGMFTDSSTTEKFTDELSKKYKVISIDLPGHGQSTYWTPKLKNVVKSLKTLMAHLNLPEYYCIGHSLGAMIATTLAIEDSGVKKTALLVPITSKKHTSKVFMKILFECVKERKVSPNYFFRKAYIQNILPFYSEEKIENRVQEILRQSKQALVSGVLWGSQTKVSENIQKLGDSCLVIAGDHDILAPMKFAEGISTNLEIIRTNHSDVDREHLKTGKNNLFVKFFEKTN